ncbi:hypothetical protein [Oceanirhabdus seepicola]|uniref:Uncharacterized protein n=1 Tax=Oceanirhabdus seepicola TaxID=2828781 RepID=A0A9J6NZH8_9CLOT|nr:hypothetical protein [Oceanirhabdus seepicola]MCM1989951.1 hypothetical protein [Oceanirhabdus seepicola]
MEKINLSSLQPCDVLLCRGEGLFSDMIVLLDGGTYSHAALYAGKIDGKHCIMQATGRGIVCDPIEKIKEETFVDVLRFNKDKHKLGEANYPYKPILEIGQAYVDSHVKYAYDHLIILALLTITRDIPLDSFSKKLLRGILDQAADFIFKQLDKGVVPMVCSEIVYRCYDEADNNKKYQLSISDLTLNKFSKHSQEVKVEGFAIENTMDDLDRDFKKSEERFLEAYYKKKEKENKLKGTFTDMVDSCVSPKDLEDSKELTKIGRLSFN